jgi:hypothetical protein
MLTRYFYLDIIFLAWLYAIRSSHGVNKSLKEEIMTTQDNAETKTLQDKGHGPKYHINIEGTIYDWDHDTITVPELRALGNLPQNLPVIEINLRTNTERELVEDEIIQIKPGMGYAKKVSFKRG